MFFLEFLFPFSANKYWQPRRSQSCYKGHRQCVNEHMVTPIFYCIFLMYATWLPTAWSLRNLLNTSNYLNWGYTSLRLKGNGTKHGCGTHEKKSPASLRRHRHYAILRPQRVNTRQSREFKKLLRRRRRQRRFKNELVFYLRIWAYS